MTIKLQVPPKIVVESNGIPLSSDVDVLNFDGGLITTVDVYGKATISSFGRGSANIKAGTVDAASFTGNPRVTTVTFTTAFSSSNYAIIITGVDSRSWSYLSKSASGFTISANSALALTGEVSWYAIISGEFS
jgi:hypothetical protein